MRRSLISYWEEVFSACRKKLLNIVLNSWYFSTALHYTRHDPTKNRRQCFHQYYLPILSNNLEKSVINDYFEVCWTFNNYNYLLFQIQSRRSITNEKIHRVLVQILPLTKRSLCIVVLQLLLSLLSILLVIRIFPELWLGH